jgi:hypothetical protein
MRLKDEFAPELRVPITAEGRSITPLAYPESTWDTIRFMALYMFNGAEKINRLVTGYGTYRMAIARGATHEQAIALARGPIRDISALPQALQAFARRNQQGVITRTQFRYAVDDLPLALRGPTMQTLLQFKSFFIKEIEFISSLRGEEIPRFIAALWAMGGFTAILNTPVGDLASLIAGTNIRDELRIRVGENEALRVAVYGIPGLLFGVDWADYLGIARTAEITRGFLGPAVSDFKEFAILASRAVKHGRILDQDWDRFVQRVSPPQMRRFLNAMQIIADDGEIRDPYTGKVIYKTEDIYGEALRAAFGSPSLRLATERAKMRLILQEREKVIEEREDVMRRYAEAVLQDKDTEKARQIIQEAERRGLVIRNEDLIDALRRFSLPQVLRAPGMAPAEVELRRPELFER